MSLLGQRRGPPVRDVGYEPSAQQESQEVLTVSALRTWRQHQTWVSWCRCRVGRGLTAIRLRHPYVNEARHINTESIRTVHKRRSNQKTEEDERSCQYVGLFPTYDYDNVSQTAYTVFVRNSSPGKSPSGLRLFHSWL